MYTKIDANVSLLLKYLFVGIVIYAVVAWKFEKPDSLLGVLENVISNITGAAIALMRVGPPNTRSSNDKRIEQ